jgi:hypothetical protein
VTTVCILFSVDQQYLQNDIIMEKLIQTLFLIIKKKQNNRNKKTQQTKVKRKQ